MLQNLPKFMYRQFLNHKLSMVIKIFCLSIGMATSLLIMLYIFHEFSFDDFHEQKDDIYQMITTSRSSDIVDNSAVATAGPGPTLLQTFPEIHKMCRLSTPKTAYFVYGDNSLTTNDILFADSSFFEIFSFPMMSGNPQQALKNPFTMVVTPEFARRYFGEADPMGKILSYNGKYNFRITGIAEPPPANSHIAFNALLSFSSLYEMEGYYLGWDGGWGYYTYLQASDEIAGADFQEKLEPLLEEKINRKYRNYGAEISLSFQPLSDVYLYSHAPETQVRSGNINNLMIFGAIGFFILLIACINFINISTAQFAQRAKETGIRKVLGAGRKTLIFRFLTETILISLMSLVISLLFIEVLLPGFNRLFSTAMSMHQISFIKVFGLFLITGIFTGFLAGLYPSFFLSGFSPLKVLKGGVISVNKGRALRNVLVVLQFFLATGLIICTMTVYRQISWFLDKPTGFDQANYLIVELTGEKSMAGYQLLKQELLSLPEVGGVTASTAIPGLGVTRNGYIPEGHTNSMMINVMDVDKDFLETLGIDITRGKGFNPGSGSDHNILINRSLAGQLGWSNPVGKKITRNGDHTISGVVGDFHYAPMHHPIQPLIITNIPWEGHQDGFDYLIVKPAGNSAASVIPKLEKIWKTNFPSEPFIFHFIDNMKSSMYAGEKTFGGIFSWASVLAIVIAGLGLFGLTTFITQQRRKEIGIRKTFGADSSRIVWLLGKQFIILVVAGNLLAWPVAWLLMQAWLDNFAYSAPIGSWVYIITLVITVMFAFATVAWQSVKASMQNPVDSLRYE
jgi:putative ABC transport system permease protein